MPRTRRPSRLARAAAAAPMAPTPMISSVLPLTGAGKMDPPKPRGARAQILARKFPADENLGPLHRVLEALEVPRDPRPQPSRQRPMPATGSGPALRRDPENLVVAAAVVDVQRDPPAVHERCRA